MTVAAGVHALRWRRISLFVLPMKKLALACLFSLPLAFGASAQNNPDNSTPPPTPAATPSPNQSLKDEQEKLTLENGIAKQKLERELADLQAEKQRLEIEAATISKKLELEQAKRKAALETELADIRAELDKLKAKNELAAAKLAEKQSELQLKDQEVQLRIKELQLEKTQFDIQVAKFSAEIDLWEKRGDWKNRVNREIQYTEEPLKDGVLTISDRRIPLNGPITMETADYICERIDYFNNQNPTYPIFIVIDSSPGGSVMAGYRILKAMEGSPAPVYTVVKSFAASMAAGITTLAKRSFAYPNAIILHHQLSSGNFGNLTVQQEAVRNMEEWWRRLATPVANKMGIPLDEFVKQMYANTSTGDWKEFADRAKELKWVDEIVETIREESLVKNPDIADATPQRQPTSPYLSEQTDSEGNRYQLLPRLNPLDCYYLYNPDGYYRTEK